MHQREAPQNPSSSDTAPVAGDACKRVRTETDDTTTTEDVSVAIDAAAAAAAAVAEFKERTKMAMDRFVEEHKCPLTTELLCDPVTAEDGHNYEREMVEKLIKDSTSSRRNKKQKKLLRSPRTNEPMGAEIKSDVSLRNTIQNFVESGLIGGEVAESWQRKMVIRMLCSAWESGTTGDSTAFLGATYWLVNGQRRPTPLESRMPCAGYARTKTQTQ
jgi:hypothetical protein